MSEVITGVNWCHCDGQILYFLNGAAGSSNLQYIVCWLVLPEILWLAFHGGLLFSSKLYQIPPSSILEHRACLMKCRNVKSTESTESKGNMFCTFQDCSAIAPAALISWDFGLVPLSLSAKFACECFLCGVAEVSYFAVEVLKSDVVFTQRR